MKVTGKKVTPVPPPEDYTLTLDLESATCLRGLLGNISTCTYETGPVGKTVMGIYRALADMGVPSSPSPWEESTRPWPRLRDDA